RGTSPVPPQRVEAPRLRPGGVARRGGCRRLERGALVLLELPDGRGGERDLLLLRQLLAVALLRQQAAGGGREQARVVVAAAELLEVEDAPQVAGVGG